MRRWQQGFTLIEVLVALGIVAIALVAGLKATVALTDNALRQSDMLLARLCADNELVRVRLSRQMPDVGDTASVCRQGGEAFEVILTATPTPNPNFRRVDASVRRGDAQVLRVSTIVGRY